MESQNKLVIISRYQENLDWVKKLDSNIVIYNKDEHDYHEFPNHKVPNYGRESETFLRAIIDHYNQLSDFDSVTFGVRCVIFFPVLRHTNIYKDLLTCFNSFRQQLR